MYYMIISLYFLRVIYAYHFCLYLTFFFLSPLLINLLFFESCGFSYTTQTQCHSGGTTSFLYSPPTKINIALNVARVIINK